MERATELELIDELQTIKEEGSFYLNDAVSKVPVEVYTSEARFEAEREKIFRKHPQAVIHATELGGPGAFQRADVYGVPVLITRDKTGEAHAFLNVCRHRGTRLVDDQSGCKHLFSCPYHAWTYSGKGELVAAPHFDAGFKGQDKSDFNLVELPCVERYGFIWVVAESGQNFDFDAYFEPLADDMAKLDLENHVIVGDHSLDLKANWKILVEGGIEAYHFKVAHKTTIGPHFEDNLSSYRSLGEHMRSVLPRTSLDKLKGQSREEWRIRDHAQLLYMVFPNTQFLVQQDHVAWIKGEAQSAGRTKLRLVTLAPKQTAENTQHWERNHKITSVTLDEDFVIGESIQASFAAGANSHLTFGQFEGALEVFNKTVEGYLG